MRPATMTWEATEEDRGGALLSFILEGGSGVDGIPLTASAGAVGAADGPRDGQRRAGPRAAAVLRRRAPDAREAGAGR